MEIDPDKFLYLVTTGEGEDTAFVVARTLSEALFKWKDAVATFANEDFKSEGITDRFMTIEDVDDPESIQLIGEPGQLIL